MIESQGSGRDASVRVRTPQAIFLVGFMGTGKTAVGHAMSQRLGWRFEDLDVSIATREQRTIAEIFREFGELHFRKLEHAALAELVNAARLGSHFIAVWKCRTFDFPEVRDGFSGYANRRTLGTVLCTRRGGASAAIGSGAISKIV
jgi:shikimate kinase